MDEDLYYHRVIATTSPPRPRYPPSYQRSGTQGAAQRGQDKRVKTVDRKKKHLPPATSLHCGSADGLRPTMDVLPNYTSSINLEGIFMKKHEIEETTKRAEDRRWHTTYVALTGTALNLYTVKKKKGWGKTKDGPAISPDNPPWMRKAKLEKSYSLLYADAGIAADYKKRRYVIRVRAETDQFLLSCIELSTFNRWLEGLFAAIDVALPIEDRDFPRDMSIPRVQRIRWYRGQAVAGHQYPIPTPRPLEPQHQTNGPFPQRPLARMASSPELLSPIGQTEPRPPLPPDGRQPNQPEVEPVFLEDDDEEEEEEDGRGVGDGDGEDDDENEGDNNVTAPPPRIDPVHRLSTTSYANASIDPHSGKWFPEHQWSSAHDLLYAKLCYSNLLFRSPRKSNYIISKGKKWYVDWTTGRMVRVLPPAYGEVEYFGAWQVIHTTENRRL
jgi:hypothetical protein